MSNQTVPLDIVTDETKIITKPGIDETENEFRVRLRDPGDFQDNTFRTITVKQDKPRIFGIVGRLKGEETTTLQALRFPKDEGWDRGKVEDWMSSHEDIGKALEELIAEDATQYRTLEELLAKAPDGPFHKMQALEIKAINEDGLEVDVVISTGRIDRDREVVLPKGIKFDGRLPLMSSHDYTDLQKQIGDVMRIKRTDEQAVARLRYFAGMGNPEADWAWTLVKLGVPAYSIGFIPKKWQDADLSNEKVAQAVLAGKQPIRTFTEVELVEVSHVAVPSNRDAVRLALTKGLLNQEQHDTLVAKLAELFKGEEGEIGAPAQTSEESIASTVDPGDILSLFQKQGSWKVGGSRDFPMVEDDTWDASAAMEGMRQLCGGDNRDWMRYRKGFVVYDSANPEQEGSYKLPFAKVVGGEMRASRRGLIAVRQVLAGGRGGVDLPEDVQNAAERFINSYLGAPEKGTVQIEFDTSKLTETLEQFMTDLEAELPNLIERNLKDVLESALADVQNRVKKLEETVPQLSTRLDKEAARIPALAPDSAAHLSTPALVAAVTNAVKTYVRQQISAAAADVDQYRRTVPGSR
ncbi:MAG TPA: hypothetical protein VIV15_12660 [Anaerolineales bacterium]